MEIKYFQDIDSGAIFACLGSWGSTAIFRLSDPEDKNAKWEFLVPESPAWDSVHQRIYRNPKVEEIVPEQYPNTLPPLPAIPNGPFPKWREYFLSEKPIPASHYPEISNHLRSQPAAVMRVFVVLSEDRYESLFGDGEFHYFKAVFMAPEDASAFRSQNESEWEKLHLRCLEIQLQNNKLEFPDFNPQLFDRFRIEEVLQSLETRLHDQTTKGMGTDR